MPRTADPPAVQKAKGNPGRRKSAVAKREEEIARIADISPQRRRPCRPECAAGADRPRPDVRGRDCGVEDDGAEAVATHRLQQQHRPIFAMFCVYYAEWVLANEDIIRNGVTQDVKTVVRRLDGADPARSSRSATTASIRCSSCPPGSA
jgi:hypothetical protein